MAISKLTLLCLGFVFMAVISQSYAKYESFVNKFAQCNSLTKTEQISCVKDLIIPFCDKKVRKGKEPDMKSCFANVKKAADKNRMEEQVAEEEEIKAQQPDPFKDALPLGGGGSLGPLQPQLVSPPLNPGLEVVNPELPSSPMDPTVTNFPDEIASKPYDDYSKVVSFLEGPQRGKNCNRNMTIIDIDLKPIVEYIKRMLGGGTEFCRKYFYAREHEDIIAECPEGFHYEIEYGSCFASCPTGFDGEGPFVSVFFSFNLFVSSTNIFVYFFLKISVGQRFVKKNFQKNMGQFVQMVKHLNRNNLNKMPGPMLCCLVAQDSPSLEIFV